MKRIIDNDSVKTTFYSTVMMKGVHKEYPCEVIENEKKIYV